MEDKLYTIQKQFGREGVVFSYCGAITQELVEGLGDVLKTQTQLQEASFSAQMKLFSTLVEMLQNILHYSQEKLINSTVKGDTEVRKGIIVIGNLEGRYYLNSGNLIENKDRDKLEKKLSAIIGMDKKELKAMYKERRRMPPEESSKGAGLGFLEMARNSSNLNFNFMEVNNMFSFFSLKVCF